MWRGTLLESVASGGLRIIWKANDDGTTENIKWAVLSLSDRAAARARPSGVFRRGEREHSRASRQDYGELAGDMVATLHDEEHQLGNSERGAERSTPWLFRRQYRSGPYSTIPTTKDDITCTTVLAAQFIRQALAVQESRNCGRSVVRHRRGAC